MRRVSSATREATNLSQFLHALAGSCRNQYRCRVSVTNPAPLVQRERICLVVDVQHRHMRCADLLQYAADRSDLAVTIGVGSVDHVQHQVRFSHLLERSSERRDQGVGQPVDKANRIRD